MHALRNIAFGILALITICLGAATVVEHCVGSPEAFQLFYHSPWMICLWTLMSAAALAYLAKSLRKISYSAMAIHLSLAVILAGAAISFFTSLSGKIVLEEGCEATSNFLLSDGTETSLPFTLALDNYSIKYYPGTSTPMDYETRIIVNSRGQNRSFNVSMNKVATVDNYRFFQTALGQGYSVLSVQHDPWGIGVSYAGYCLLILSSILFFFDPKTRFRSLLRSIAMVSLIIAPLSATAAENEPRVLQKPLARDFGSLYAYWGGRVVPMQTVARDFCIKIYGKSSYRGYTAEQVLTGWIFYYDDWKRQPMIKLKGIAAQRATESHGKYASLQDFFRNGKYIFSDSLRQNQADILAADEKFGIIAQLCTGNLLKIIPVEKKGGNTEWYSWAEQLPSGTNVGQRIDYALEMDRMAREIAHGHFRDADSTIIRIKALQTSQAGLANLPSPARISAERFYNRIANPWLKVGIVFTASLLAFVFRRKKAVASVFVAVALATVLLFLILQSIISGHIPMSNGSETMQTLAFLSLAAALTLSRQIPMIQLPATIVATLALVVAALSDSNPTLSPLIPVLASPLLAVHVVLVMISYSLFAIMMLNSGAALLQKDKQKQRKAAAISTSFLYPAIFCLGAGIFIGAVWANQSWGRYWGWDPKETWALITFFVYAFPLHSSSFKAFRSAKVLNIYYCIAFLAVLATYFGVNYLLGGMHSYANT